MENLELAFFNLGPGEMVVLAVLVLLIFGGKKLPEFGKGLGSMMKEFKKASEGLMDSNDNVVASQKIEEEPKKEIGTESTAQGEEKKPAGV